MEQNTNQIRPSINHNIKTIPHRKTFEKTRKYGQNTKKKKEGYDSMQKFKA